MKKYSSKKHQRESLNDIMSNMGGPGDFPDWEKYRGLYYDEMGADPVETPAAGKKRGAPKGNQNARKHGLYSKIAPARRRGDMDKALDMESLTQEAAMLRLLLAKLMENPDENLKEILQILRVLTPIVKLNLMVEDDDDSLF